MVSGVENNTSLNNRPHIGVLNPPNMLYTPEIYSDKEAGKQFEKIAYDLYEKKNSQKFEHKRKTPISVICTIVTAAVVASWIVIKKAMKW